MTMHLEGPWLSTTGKKRGKQKWASAEQKRKAEELAASWQRQIVALDKLSNTKFSREAKAVKKSLQRAVLDLKMPAPPGRETVYIPSRDTGWVPCVKVHDQEYTGTKIKGIGTMHKSNAVPIFTDEEAKDISKMRR